MTELTKILMQVPALAVLAYLTYMFVKTVKDLVDAFTSTIVKLEESHQQVQLEGITAMNEVRRAMIDLQKSVQNGD